MFDAFVYSQRTAYLFAFKYEQSQIKGSNSLVIVLFNCNFNPVLVPYLQYQHTFCQFKNWYTKFGLILSIPS